MPNEFIPPPIPPVSSTTVPVVREDVRTYARVLEQELLKLNTYVNTLGSGGGGGSGNLDGGHSDTNYGGTTAVDGGSA